MRAARLHANRDLRVDEAPRPGAALAPHEVLVRSVLCGICGTDLAEYDRGPIWTPTEPHAVTGISLPVILGHEFVGIVQAVGSAVTGLGPGQRVSCMPHGYCGMCDQCRRGREKTCLVGSSVGINTAWAGLGEWGVYMDYQLSPIPDGMSDVEAALVEPTAVAVSAVAAGGIAAGDAVLVTGGGPIGQLVALASKALGAGRIFITEPQPWRRQRAAQLAIAHVIDPTAESVMEVVKDETRGIGADLAIECSGSQDGVDSCLLSVRPGGTIVQTALGKPVTLDAAADLTSRDVTYRGVYIYPVTSWPRVIDLIATRALPVSQVVSDVIDLEDVVGGFRRLLCPDTEILKMLVRMSPPA